MEFATKAAAVESAREFMELHRGYWPAWEGETEIRQMFGPEDYPMEDGGFRLKPESLAQE
jgi:proline dehydrogenase